MIPLLFGEGLQSLLALQAHEVVCEAEKGREACDIEREVVPEMVLIDYSCRKWMARRNWSRPTTERQYRQPRRNKSDQLLFAAIKVAGIPPQEPRSR